MTVDEIVRLWTDALRSGEFKQGKSKLRDIEDNYCCLGVLCELAVRAGVIEPAKPITANGVRVRYTYDNYGGFLPPVVQEWAHLSSDCGQYLGHHALYSENDHGVPFEDIAKTIESKPKGLFSESEEETNTEASA